MRISGAVAYRYSLVLACFYCTSRLEIGSRGWDHEPGRGVPCLIVLNTRGMGSCENSVPSLGLIGRFVRLAGPAQGAKELLSSLAADVHHVGIIRDLAQNQRYRVQLLN